MPRDWSIESIKIPAWLRLLGRCNVEMAPFCKSNKGLSVVMLDHQNLLCQAAAVESRRHWNPRVNVNRHLPISHSGTMGLVESSSFLIVTRLKAASVAA